MQMHHLVEALGNAMLQDHEGWSNQIPARLLALCMAPMIQQASVLHIGGHLVEALGDTVLEDHVRLSAQICITT